MKDPLLQHGYVPDLDYVPESLHDAYLRHNHDHSPGAFPTLLDTPETSVDFAPLRPIYFSYAKHIRAPLKERFDAVKRVYHATDKRDEKKREMYLNACGSNAYFVVDKESREVRVAASRCGLRWCPTCQRHKQSFITQEVQDWISGVELPKFLTLTLKHSDDPLEDQIRRLYECFQKLRKWKRFQAYVYGGVWFFQVKRSKESGQWHPHLHILLCSEYMPHERISSMWLECTGDSDIVDIRAVKSPQQVASYVARYATNPAELETMSEADAIEVFDALHSRRLYGKFGIASALRFTPPKLSDLHNYLVLCPFGEAIADRGVKPIMMEIYQAWITGEPLADDIDLSWFEPSPVDDDGAPDDAFEYEPVRFKQFYLDFYARS